MSRDVLGVDVDLAPAAERDAVGHSTLVLADAEPVVQVVPERPERDAQLVGSATSARRRPTEPPVRDDPVDHEQQCEDEQAATKASPQVSGVPGGRRLPT